MKQEWRAYAPYGLWLAGIAGLVALALFTIQRAWDWPLQLALALVVIGLAAFALLDPERVRELLTGRQARYGSNALILSVAFIGILVIVNVLVYQNSKRWDLTEDRQFTLTPETLNTLEALPEKVTARAFFSARVPTDQARNLLDQYAFNSEGKFSFQFIDPERDPLAAQSANITRDGTVVLALGDRQQPVTTLTEQELTGALVRLINPEQRSVYFLTGHGEYSPEETGDQSYSSVKRVLESKNYVVKTLSLLTSSAIPEDASVIVVAGARKPVSANEVALLNAYLDQGGAVIVMAEPLPLTDFGDAADPLAESLAQNWGIQFGNDIVVDLSSQQPFAPYAASYGKHAITDRMGRMAAQFPSARSVSAPAATQSISTVQIVLTSQQSWGETDLQGLMQSSQNASDQVKFDEGVDLPGPLALAVVGENFTTQGRVVVFGDADFVVDGNIGAYGNSDLFVNSVDWAAGQEQLISLTPKTNTQRMMISPQQNSLGFIMYLMIIFIPQIIGLVGFAVWMIRRRRG
jgi:ABC-type uncharacterized transport system involved in gliding motility auxiliary subunit